VITGPSKLAVQETLCSDIAKSFAFNMSDKVWERHGARHPMGEGFSGFQDGIPQTINQQSVLAATATVPPTLLENTILTRRPREVIDQAAVWRDHGVRYIVVCNLSFLQPSLKKGLMAGRPLMRVLRGLRRL
jgi:phthiodiolone/phenolphthiodiolone dimycocerosates ketoreductase